jgi:hypothetical protein
MSLPAPTAGSGIPAFAGGASLPAAPPGLVAPERSPLTAPQGRAQSDQLAQLLDDPRLLDALAEDGPPTEQDPVGDPDAERGDVDEADGGQEENDVELAVPTTGPTTVRLPDGELVIAPSPQIAGAIRAATEGAPIAEAFHRNGITLPPPGTAVEHPVDPGRLVPGDVGMFTDRHALAVGRDKAVLNGHIQPIAGVTGPSFLGWEHPPQPGPVAPASTSTSPTPTRPAASAGTS